MKLQKFSITLLFVMLTTLAVKASDTTHAYIDINNIKDDKLYVEVVVPTVTTETVEYHMPKIVPGTYSIYDFGQFLSDFKAYDTEGNELKVKSITENRWEISDATKLHKVAYWVEDTYDTDRETQVFQPAGTNIEEDNIVMNTFGFIGYLEGFKNTPFELHVTRPATYYGSTALKRNEAKGNTDTFLAGDYFTLHDSPIFYAVPDTATIQLGGATIEVALYSPNKVVTAKEVMESVKEIMTAQKDYLGGKLPVDKYAILIYLEDSPVNGYGALEHSYSTMFFLPENMGDSFFQTVKDITAHEFFHIVTPLSIHSEHIHDYDFINPSMSKHLWLYEGVTEYAANHVQIKHGLIDLNTFLSNMQQKVVSAYDGFNDRVPFTVMSKNALGIYEEEYGNVYQKGALIGMCLDIKLLQLSNGEYDLQQLLRELAKEYGTEKPFEDDMLFDKITEMTYPEIREFFIRYVEGAEELPLSEYLDYVGINYVPEREIKAFSMFGSEDIALNYNPTTKRIFVQDVGTVNEFGEDLGFEKGDEFVSFNGQEVTLAAVSTPDNMFTQFMENVKEGDKVVYVVARPKKAGKFKNKKLKAKAVKVPAKDKYVLEANEEATAEQLKLRKAWINQ